MLENVALIVEIEKTVPGFKSLLIELEREDLKIVKNK